ncbi:MAG TPA: serine hydrolase domain-containing protein [Bacteroidales bacterium]|nr:serine hydrolase domain-containing protein [Bacteroidales bacterium]HNS46030.1 serine hydrolase domain-containing protein [Bacteroidales bacterium]
MEPIHLSRFIFWNFAGVDDLWRFPYHRIEKGTASFHFKDSPQPVHLSVPDSYPTRDGMPFEKFLQNHKTTCFLIIRDDSIIYEKYFYGYTAETIFPSFSVTKTFVSALTGIAIGEGIIKSTDQKVTDFLPWMKRDGFQHISIEHLLNMRSGIRFNESYSNPFGDAAQFYYGTNLRKYVRHLKIKEPPGLRYHYNSANQQILGYILEAATGKRISKYLEEKLWKPLGMEQNATWNTDSEKHDDIKMFGCLNATPRDFARFGRLYLKNGLWNGKQIIPQEWIIRSTRVINDSLDGDGYPFTYNWRVLDDGASFFAKGMLGQYIFVNRPKNLILLRFGKAYSGIDWANFCNRLTEML